MSADLHLIPQLTETISGLSQLLAKKEISVVEILHHCLAQIDRYEPEVHAWVQLDREAAMSQARLLDSELSRQPRSPLHGIPLGIKDLYDWQGLPTAAGFAPWKNRIASQDAPVIARLREQGAVLLGKTVTTQFASFDPPITRNPWNLERTPGGSSSGSAAAVATGMCIAALGSQTGGSITRPATFCGVAGFKPSYGLFSCKGVIPLAPSMDHPGPMARSVRDLGLVSASLAPESFGTPEEWIKSSSSQPPRLGFVRGHFETLADPECWQRLLETIDCFRKQGASVIEVPLFTGFEEILPLHRRIMATEAARYHRDRMQSAREFILPWVASLMEEGLQTTEEQYQAALSHQALSKQRVSELFRDCQAILCPATQGPAPLANSTGNPCMNSPSSYLGIPAVSFPTGLSSEGLPLGLQILGPFQSDRRTLEIALWCEQAWQQCWQP